MAAEVTTTGPDEFGRVSLYVNGELVAWEMRPEWAETKGDD